MIKQSYLGKAAYALFLMLNSYAGSWLGLSA